MRKYSTIRLQEKKRLARNLVSQFFRVIRVITTNADEFHSGPFFREVL